MYFKWDLFRKHIKIGFMWLKMGLLKWLLFCMGKTHKNTNVRMSVCPSIRPTLCPGHNS